MTKPLKVFFATDVHGSEIVWRKWLSVPQIYGASVLILAGDLTGKAIVPIVETNAGTYECKLFDEKKVARTEKELQELKVLSARVGYYPHVMTPKELDDLRSKPKRVDALFKRLTVERMSRWLELLEEKVSSNVKAIVMPGNDDSFDIDPVLKQSEHVMYSLKRCIQPFLDYEMISLDYTNPTPWNTPRECDEKELWRKLEKLANTVSTDWDKVICNFHCPPHGTHIDSAPKLDSNLKVMSSIIEPTMYEHVGSESVFRFIKEHQPLLGLHGHIHEAGGFDLIENTRVFNPGSEYAEGILRGYMLEFTGEKMGNWWKISG